MTSIKIMCYIEPINLFNVDNNKDNHMYINNYQLEFTNELNVNNNVLNNLHNNELNNLYNNELNNELYNEVNNELIHEITNEENNTFLHVFIVALSLFLFYIAILTNADKIFIAIGI